MTAAKVPDPQVKSSGCPSGALQHLPKVQQSNTEQQKKTLGNTWKTPSSGIPQVEMSPLPATLMGRLRSEAGLGGPKLTTESLGMGKCHLRLSWGTPNPSLGDTDPCSRRHRALSWGTLSLVLAMGWETPTQTMT